MTQPLLPGRNIKGNLDNMEKLLELIIARSKAGYEIASVRNVLPVMSDFTEIKHLAVELMLLVSSCHKGEYRQVNIRQEVECERKAKRLR